MKANPIDEFRDVPVTMRINELGCCVEDVVVGGAYIDSFRMSEDGCSGIGVR